MFEQVLWYFIPLATILILSVLALIALSVIATHFLYTDETSRGCLAYLVGLFAVLIPVLVGILWGSLEQDRVILPNPTPTLGIASIPTDYPTLNPEIGQIPNTHAPLPPLYTPVASTMLGTPTVWLAASGPDTLPGADDIVQEQLDELDDGLFAFNPPIEMTVGEADRVEVRIQNSLITNTTALTAGLLGPGQPIVEPVKVGRFMQAKLTGEGFDISPLTNEEQVVGDEGFTRWVWDVLPLESGQRNLLLTVNVRLKLPDGPEEIKTYTVKEKHVIVHVNPVYSVIQFLDANWQFMTTAAITLAATVIAVPSAILMYRELSKRKNPTNPTKKPGAKTARQPRRR